MSHQPSSIIGSPWLPYVLIVLGLAAIALGLSWNRVPDEVFWSDQQAAEYEQAYNDAHEASIGPGHTHGSATSEMAGEGSHLVLDEAKAKLAAMENELEAARRARRTWGRILSVGGLVFAGGGLVLLRRAEG